VYRTALELDPEHCAVIANPKGEDNQLEMPGSESNSVRRRAGCDPHSAADRPSRSRRGIEKNLPPELRMSHRPFNEALARCAAVEVTSGPQA